MIIINVTKGLFNLDGNAILDGSDNKNPMILRSVLCNALLSHRAEEKLSGADKVERYDLAMRIHKNDKVEMEVKEVNTIMELIAAMYTPLIVGQVFPMLDPPSEDK